jgi:hypothetical protein
MTHRQGPRSALVALVVACCALVARADEPPAWPYVPPPEQGAPTVEARLITNNTQVELIDLATGQPIIGQGTNVTLWDDYARGDAVRPTLELRPQPTGFDLVYTFTNQTAAPKPMGRLRMGSMLLGQNITWQDVTYLSNDRTATPGSWNMITRNYPASWYSPVAVFRNADYAVGVSLIYPMMEYKHDVRVVLNNTSVPGRGHDGWEAIFQLQNFGDEGAYDRLGYQHDLQPGETRSYVLAVRVSRDQNDWLRTLLPYRDFFLKFYGGVHYARNTEPIIGFTTGITSYISADNPYGFGSWRPDLNGWNSFTSGLRTLQGWKNVMVWKPTGHYRFHPGGNMPFNFTTQWMADPELATALDPNTGFPSVVSAGKNLGFWWGHAASVYFGWDTDHAEALDPDNPEHVRRANAELDLAVQAGATMIGLDTFHPWFDAPWNLTRWVRMMQARHPNVRFVAEPISFDILHAYVPAFMQGFISGGNPQTVDDLYPLRQPHTLANFILPGNEIWTSYMYAPHQHYFQITPTDQMVNDDIARYAALGFTPIMFPPINVTLQNRPDQRAAEAWHQVVPADLLASYRWNRNYSNGAIVRRPDGSMAIIEASNPSPAAPPQPVPPPSTPTQGDQPAGGGDAGGGMVMGSVPDQARHARSAAKRAAPINPADAVPDQVASTESTRLDAATATQGAKGRVDSKVRSGAGPARQSTKVDTSAPPHVDASSSGGGSGPVLTGARPGAISVVPSSTPGLHRGASASGYTVPGAVTSRSLQGMTYSAVQQAILRAQRARPAPGAAEVVKVEP